MNTTEKWARLKAIVADRLEHGEDFTAHELRQLMIKLERGESK